MENDRGAHPRRDVAPHWVGRVAPEQGQTCVQGSGYSGLSPPESDITLVIHLPQNTLEFGL